MLIRNFKFMLNIFLCVIKCIVLLADIRAGSAITYKPASDGFYFKYVYQDVWNLRQKLTFLCTLHGMFW